MTGQPARRARGSRSDRSLPDLWSPMIAPIEYWFFRTEWPRGALLVDFIWRRRPASAEVRVSCCADGQADTHRSVQRWDSGEPLGAVAGCAFDRNESSGSVGPVSWDLRFEREPAQLLVPPSPLRWARALDASVASWPMCSATGRVRVGATDAAVRHRPAMTCHYWGRQLPQEWVWLSANDFERTGTAVEVALMRSAQWGVKVPLPVVGYAWLRKDGRESLVASPLTGLVTLRVRSRYCRRSGGTGPTRKIWASRRRAQRFRSSTSGMALPSR